MLDAPGRRPRPVAGLPSPAPVAVAKGWLLELLAERPLEEIAGVPTALVAREAPALCEAVVEAVADDHALARLRDGGDRAALAARAGALTGATSPAAVVAGVEALRAVLHRALRVDDDADTASATGDRLAHVCALVTSAALSAPALAPAEEPLRASAPAPGPSAVPDLPPLYAPGPRVTPLEPTGRVVVAQDLRAEPAHLSALTVALEEAGGEPVALLAIELDDRERLMQIEGEHELVGMLAPAENALAAATGVEGILVREEPGCWWLVAPGMGTDAARVLAHRCAQSFAANSPVLHGASLTVCMGIAVSPDDGADPAALLKHADEGVFTARALGVPVA